MYVFGYLGPDVRIMLKWVLQQASQEMDLLNLFSHTHAFVIMDCEVVCYRQFAPPPSKKNQFNAVNKRN